MDPTRGAFLCCSDDGISRRSLRFAQIFTEILLWAFWQKCQMPWGRSCCDVFLCAAEVAQRIPNGISFTILRRQASQNWGSKWMENCVQAIQSSWAAAWNTNNAGPETDGHIWPFLKCSMNFRDDGTSIDATYTGLKTVFWTSASIFLKVMATIRRWHSLIHNMFHLFFHSPE